MNNCLKCALVCLQNIYRLN